MLCASTSPRAACAFASWLALALALADLAGCRSAPPSASPAPLAAASPSPAPPAPPACESPGVRVVPAATGVATATLVLLHGYGGSAADMEPVGRALARGVPGLAVLVPDGCEAWEGGAGAAGGRQWFGIRAMRDDQRAARVRLAAERVLGLVAVELPKRGLPAAPLAFAGFSQGAMISQWLAVHARPRPLAVVSFSGRFDDDAPPTVEAGRAVPLLLVHGERDPVIPFAQADRAAALLAARGVRVERLTRPDLAHGIDDASLAGAVSFLTREVGPGH